MADPAAIDWQDIRVRLAAAQAALRSNSLRSEERTRIVFRQRAARLACREDMTDPINLIPVLSFSIAGEIFALALSSLSRIMPLKDWTLVPDAPAPLLGVVNLNEEMCPLLDLAALLGMSSSGTGDKDMGLFLRKGRNAVGFKVDTADSIHFIEEQAIAGKALNGADSAVLAKDYIRARLVDGMTLLDGNALVQHPILSGE